jgi:hypothetical protein
MSSLQAKHLLIDVAPNLIDSDPTGMTLLSTDLHVALVYLNRHDALRVRLRQMGETLQH